MGTAAWLVEEPGGAFRKIELAHTALREKHVRVRVAVAGVNPLDTKIRLGKAAHARQPLPAVLGLDMAGTVEGDWDGGARRSSQAMKCTAWWAEWAVCRGTLAQAIDVDADLLAHQAEEPVDAAKQQLCPLR